MISNDMFYYDGLKVESCREQVENRDTGINGLMSHSEEQDLGSAS